MVGVLSGKGWSVRPVLMLARSVTFTGTGVVVVVGWRGWREGERADVRRAANVSDVCASLCCLHDVISCCFRVLFFNDVTQSVGLFSS